MQLTARKDGHSTKESNMAQNRPQTPIEGIIDMIRTFQRARMRPPLEIRLHENDGIAFLGELEAAFPDSAQTNAREDITKVVEQADGTFRGEVHLYGVLISWRMRNFKLPPYPSATLRRMYRSGDGSIESSDFTIPIVRKE